MLLHPPDHFYTHSSIVIRTFPWLHNRLFMGFSIFVKRPVPLRSCSVVHKICTDIIPDIFCSIQIFHMIRALLPAIDKSDYRFCLYPPDPSRIYNTILRLIYQRMIDICSIVMFFVIDSVITLSFLVYSGSPNTSRPRSTSQAVSMS